jgi:urate oxidase
MVEVLLQGDNLTEAYEFGNNDVVLPTDTIKNTIYVLAKDYLNDDIENFAISIGKLIFFNIGKYFLEKKFKEVHVEIVETIWERAKVKNKDHFHGFIQKSDYSRFCSLKANPKENNLISGFNDFKIMKTTQSGFTGYIKDQYTSLKPTTDRIINTKVSCNWTYKGGILKDGSKYNQVFNKILQTVVEQFLGEDNEKGIYSESVQQDIYRMGKKVVEELTDIDEIFFALPNVHCFLYDLNRFGIENKNVIWEVTTHPYGKN